MTTVNKKTAVVLISGGGSNLQSLLDACKDPAYPLSISAVISNRPDVHGLERAKTAGVTAVTVDHKAYPDRASFDAELQKTIDAHQPDLLILAGFMRILTNEFVEHYLGRMLNIHPSLLPLYPGLNTHQQALDNGDATHGASVHFVTTELDGGPVVLQTQVAINPNDDAGTLAKRVLTEEHKIYPLATRWFAEGRLSYHDHKAWLDNKILEQPCQLDTEGKTTCDT